MSKAFKCDRCEKCFDPTDLAESEAFVSIPEVTSQTSGDYINNKTSFRKSSVNLCEDCTKEFMIWMAHIGYVMQFDTGE